MVHFPLSLALCLYPTVQISRKRFSIIYSKARSRTSAMQNRMQKLLAFGLVGLVAVDGATTIVTTGNNILPTQFPVTAFPETTQTHFNSPSCTSTPEKEQELTVNYNVR